MQRIRSQDKEDVDLAEGVLSWISYTLRPLTVAEIRHALAVNIRDADIDEGALPDEDLLVSVCRFGHSGSRKQRDPPGALYHPGVL